MNIKMRLSAAIFAAIALVVVPHAAHAEDTAFTYQGQLKQAGTPVNDSCDVMFALWPDPAGSVPLAVQSFDGQPGHGDPVAVTDGVFSVQLDFGSGVFDGNPRLLQVDVRCPHDPNGIAPYTTLAPMQRITPTPYATHTRGLFVDDAGNLGLGTINPVYALDVVGTSPSVMIESTDTGSASLRLKRAGDSDTANSLAISSGGDMVLRVANQDRMVVSDNGNVGIGTSNPTSRLHLRNNESEIALNMKASGSWTAQLKQTDSSFLSLVNGGSERLTIAPNGDVGLGTTAPNAHLQLTRLGQWTWALGTGWGDLSLNNGSVGFSIGVATSGGGTGDTRMWTTGGTERLMIGNPTDGTILTVNNGGVGVGITSPGAKLQVVGGTDANASGTGGFIVAGSLSGQNVAIDDNEIAARNNGALTRLSINADGGEVVLTGQAGDHVGIGTANPQVKLDVRGTGDAAGGLTGNNDVVGRFHDTSSGGSTAVSIDASSGQDAVLYFAEGGHATWGLRTDAQDSKWAEGQFELRYHRGDHNTTVTQFVAIPANTQFDMYQRGAIIPWDDATYDLGTSSASFFGGRWKDVWAANAFIQTSDRREKKNIKDLHIGLAELLRLRPVSFQWKRKHDDGSTRFGLIAQEVDKVIPNAVVKNKDPKVLWGMSYATLTPVLIKATQEQQALIERQRRQISDLTSRLERLEATVKQLAGTHEPTAVGTVAAGRSGR